MKRIYSTPQMFVLDIVAEPALLAPTGYNNMVGDDADFVKREGGKDVEKGTAVGTPWDDEW